MQVHNLIQGSPEWLAYRATHFNASDAPAMMGCSPYKTRAELLRELHTGVPADVDTATHMRFENGHRAEALARPLAEQIIGSELYPVTGSAGKLSASFDGITLFETEGFEHKALNEALRAAFEAMGKGYSGGEPDLIDCRLLPLYHRVQMEQQLHVSGAERILFMASEWTADGELVEEHHVWYYPDEELRAQILRGWDQFGRDLAAYVLPESPEPASVGRAPETLPALLIEVTGKVTASNLAEFKATALESIRSVNRNLRTDQDFADAEKAVKWCGDVESRLKAAKEHALSQTASIDALFKAIDDISAEARTVRLDLDRLVAKRKQEIREEAVARTRRALDAHVATLNAEIAPMAIQQPTVDYAGAIKGKRSIDSMHAALDQVLAEAKIEADSRARTVRANAATFQRVAEESFAFLFPDLSQLVHKAAEDFAAALDARIAQHRAAEAERAAKAAAEAAAKHAAEIARATAAAAAPAPFVPPAANPIALVAAQPANEPATLKLGTICERLGITMTAAFVTETLGVQHARTEGRALLYRDADFDRICAALHRHIERVRLEHGVGVAA